MGAASSSNKPWKDYDHFSLFSTSLERVATLMTSIGDSRKQKLFYHPLLVDRFKTFSNIQVPPQITFYQQDHEPAWYLEETETTPVLNKDVKSVILRMSLPPMSTGSPAHDITSVYFVKESKIIFLDSQLTSPDAEWMEQFKSFLSSWTGEQQIRYVFPDESCQMVQFFSENCSTWSFFFSVCAILEGWEDPTSFFKSKSQAEMGKELRSFVAWIYHDLMHEELLEEKIFKHPDLDLFGLLKFDAPLTDMLQYFKLINEQTLFYIKHFKGWRAVFLCLSIAYPEDKHQSTPFEKIASDFVDPHFFDEPCTCKTCGEWCMSKEWSVCKTEEFGEGDFDIPKPASLQKYDHDKTEDDYETWLKNASPYLYKAAKSAK